jgi:hypothetical protein
VKKMSDHVTPTSLDEWEERFYRHVLMSGGGYGQPCTLHLPCPFCAAPEFLVYRLSEAEQAIRNGGVCRHCARGTKAVAVSHPKMGQVYEMVQTCGPDTPEWMEPRMRRVEELEQQT